MDPFGSIQFEILFFLTIIITIAFSIYAGIEIAWLPGADIDTTKKIFRKEIKLRKFVIYRFAAITTVFILFWIASISSLFFSYPRMVSTYPEWDSYWRDYERPIEVQFHRPIDTKTLKLNIAPETSGTWQFEKSVPFLPFVRTVKFIPDETVYPGNKVIVYFTHVTNFFDNHDNREELLQFNSVDLPSVISSVPENNAENIPIDQEIILDLSHMEGEYVKWEFLLEGLDDKFSVERNKSDKIKIKFEEPLKQNSVYTLKVNRIPVSQDTLTGERTKSGEPKEIYSLTFKTVNVPLVQSMSPQGSNVLINTPISIIFDNDMDQASVAELLAITPKIEGNINWKDGRTLIFNHSGLQKETTYTVAMPQGVKTVHGGRTESEIKYSFSTIGAIKVAAWSPSSGSGNVKITDSIKVVFDQNVDKASAEAAFSLTPAMQGTFSWVGNNTMLFNPTTDLNHHSTYTAKLNTGIRTISGVDSNKEYVMTFSTEPKRVLINVPLYSQVNSKECQIVATRMLLGFKGISKSTSQIFSEIPKQTVQCDATNNIWGDPNQGFMGKIDGNHECASGNRGYGIYWNPISNYLSNNGISNSVKRGMTISALTQEIEAGHPVMLWWQNGWSTPNDVSWTTPDGQYIYAVNGMHSEIAIGYVGSKDNPTHIIVNDPWRGQRTLEIGHFKSLWSYFNNTGIVVY